MFLFDEIQLNRRGLLERPNNINNNNNNEVK